MSFTIVHCLATFKWQCVICIVTAYRLIALLAYYLKGANCGDWHYVLRYIIYCWVTASAICATASPGLFGASARQHVPYATLQTHTRFALEGYTSVNMALWPYLHGMDLYVQTVLIDASSDSYQSKKTAARNRLGCCRHVSTINCLVSMRGETFRDMGNHQVSTEEERMLHASASPASSLYRKAKGFSKLLPANKIDRFFKSWQSCQMPIKARQSTT